MGSRLVVVGGNAGAMGTAAQALRADPSLEVIAFERGGWTSSAACGIPFFVGGEIDSLDSLVARTPEEHRRRGIDVRLRHEVTAVDLDRRVLEARDLENARTYETGFDQLVLGTGARPLRPPLPGIDAAFVHGVQTLDDAEVLFRKAENQDCRRVVVVGGGYIGLEMAEAFKRWGASVIVVEAGDQVMRSLDPEMAAFVSEAMERIGIEVRLGTHVNGFDDHRVIVEGGDLPADLVVLGLGVTPNSELARDTGIELGARNAIKVDRRQQTSAAGVWSAGDCCESYHLVSERGVHIALGTVANRQARVAGLNIGGGRAEFPGVIGTAITRVCETEIGRTGLSEPEATEAGFDFESARIISTNHAGYYPDARPIVVKLIVERATRRLLGGQIVGGGPGVAKRIDVVATAIWNRMTAEELVNLDLSYAPPFSPVWDPVQTAARQLL
jgi:NADPH-dependent 2,4-dienoyl-CoA reductase/sulfur reductase-like enzyme